MHKNLQINTVKNVTIVLIAGLLHKKISEALSAIRSEQMNDFLLIISMILVTVSFANFAFTYEKSKLKTRAGAIITYSATAIYMLLTLLLLQTIVVAVGFVYPSLQNLVFGFSVLLYAGVVLYDYWDLARAE